MVGRQSPTRDRVERVEEDDNWVNTIRQHRELQLKDSKAANKHTKW